MIRALLILAAMAALAFGQSTFRVEDYRGKTVLLFTPHPDDDAFCCAGTLAQLVSAGADVRIVIYTNDDKGSYDPDMVSERLARIRKAEEEAGNRIIGIPPEKLIWLGHHDGMLEYVNERDLVEQVTAVIRKYRPALVMGPDPGADFVRWRKTDHRRAAMATIDGIRAAEWHLYFPNQRLQQGLEPWRVPAYLFFYVREQDANTFVNIDSTFEKKMEASLAHVSQFEPAVRKYRPDWAPGDKERAAEELKKLILRRNGRWVEAFRFATDFNQF